MIYITQLIWIKDGEAGVFDQFEAIAIPLIKKYNGQLLVRVRPGKDNFLEASIDPPYEIHLVRFPSENDFENFKLDEERKKFLHLKEQSIKSVLQVKGTAI